MARLMLLEDEVVLQEELQEYLSARGHQVTPLGTMAAFRRALAEGTFDLAIVDRGLPDGDGLDLVGELRAAGSALGIVVLTARGAVRDRVSGLDLGADHYLSKPFRLEELAAIVEALARRLEARPAPGRWTLDTVHGRLLPPGAPPVALSSRDLAVLRALMAADKRTVRRKEIIRALGEDPAGYDHRRLDTEMSRLRRRVQEAAGVELPVQTVYAVGFAFTADSIVSY